MITTVLLDAGGVILDESEHERVRAEIIVDTLSPVITGYNSSDYESDIAQAINCFCPNVYDFVFWKRLQSNRSLHAVFHNRYLDRWRHNVPPLKLMPGIGDSIRRLSRRFDVGIAGQYGREITDLLQEHGLLKYFKWKLTQDDFGTTKPDTRFYENIVHEFGVKPSECVMVGDRVDKDIIPARLLKMKTVLIRTGLHTKQEPRMPYEVPDVELRDVEDLTSAIKKLAK